MCHKYPLVIKRGLTNRQRYSTLSWAFVLDTLYIPYLVKRKEAKYDIDKLMPIDIIGCEIFPYFLCIDTIKDSCNDMIIFCMQSVIVLESY